MFTADLRVDPVGARSSRSPSVIWRRRAEVSALMALCTAVLVGCIDYGGMSQTGQITSVNSRTVCTVIVRSDGSHGARDCWESRRYKGATSPRVGECVRLREATPTAEVLGAKPVRCPPGETPSS